MTTNDFLTTVDQILTVPGTAVSESFTKARTGITTARKLMYEGEDAQALLNDAILEGTEDAIRAAIVNLTTSEAWSSNYSSLNEADKATLASLRVFYRATAAQNYGAIADAYNAAVDKLTAATKAVDTNANAEAIIGANAKAQAAWQTASALANETDRLAAILVDAAHLAGANLADTSHETPRDRQVSLFATSDDPKTRRALWDLWDEPNHRAGRFGALAAAGYLAHARPLDDAQPYRRAKGWTTEYEQSGFGHKPIKVDLETGKRYGIDGVEITTAA